VFTEAGVKFTKLASIVLIFAIILSVTAGCSKSASTTTTTTPFVVPANFTTYRDETSLYNISYPSQWEQLSEADLAAVYSQAKNAINAINSGLPVEKVSVVFFAGLKTSTGYYPSTGITVEPAPTTVLNNSMVVQGVINGIKQLDPNYQEIARTKLSINGKDAGIIEYKAHFSSTTPLMHNIVLVCLSDKTVWTVNCSATDEDFSRFANDYNNILQSFQITK
jgi:hypothetical protein